MLRRIFFAGILFSTTLGVAGQSNNKGLSSAHSVIDKSVVFPADMERNYDLLLSKWSKELKYADDCRSLSDEKVSYPDSVYIQRLYSLPTKMELAYNPVVRDYIEMYAGRRRNQVSYMLGQGKYYFPLFEEALDKEGIPLELKYLPVIESALNPIARSRAGAVGLWQFMAGTGKMYELEVNSLVDERRDPYKSSAAAAKYLKDLYSIYNDWNLVIAAYNCGPGNVNKAIRRSGGQTDYWAIYPYLPRETRGYVPAFIAATYIMSYHNEHNICPAQYPNPASMDSLVIDKTLHLQQVADIINVPIEDLRQYNPQFKSDIIPGDYRGYALNLPIQKISAFIDNKHAIFSHKTNELLTHRKVAGLDVVGGGKGANSATTLTHRVKRGDTLGALASRYNVTASQIKKWNNLSSSKLSVGRRLKIYRSVTPVEKQETSTVELASAEKTGQTTSKAPEVAQNITANALTQTKTEQKTVTTYYKVKKGDTWSAISKKTGASIADIRRWNNIKTKNIVAGRQIKIHKIEQVVIEEPIKLVEPELSMVILDSTRTADLFDGYLKKVQSSGSSLPRVRISSTDSDDEAKGKSTDDTKIIYHKVKIGETISQIAARYNVSKEDIMAWNKLSSKIAKVGQRLLILLPDPNSSGLNDSNQDDSQNKSLTAGR